MAKTIKIDVRVKLTRSFWIWMWLAARVGRIGLISLAFWMARKSVKFLKVTNA